MTRSRFGSVAPGAASRRVLTALFLAWAVLASAPTPARAADEWHELPPLVRAGGGSYYGLTGGMVHDARDDRMLFVGPDPRRLWSLDLDPGSTWEELPVANTPEGVIVLYYHAAALDSARRRVLVPAHVSTGPFSYGSLGLWALSLDAPRRWTELSVSPVFRRWDFSLVVDSARDRLLLFGGYYRASMSVTEATNEVLTYDLASGTGWTPLAVPGTRPIPRAQHAAIFDARRDRMLVFGGEQPTGLYDAIPLDETWELSFRTGAPAWRFLTPATLPPAGRRQMAATHDVVHDRLLVYAGRGQYDTQFRDAWSLPLDTSATIAWVAHGDGPERRSSPLAAFDTRRDRMIVQGGFTILVSSAILTRYDLWSFRPDDPGGWTNLRSTSQVIRNRSGHTAIRDPVRDEMVVFFGSGYGDPYDYSGHSDAWAYGLDTGIWRRLGAVSRTLREHVVVHDPPRDRFVAFLGCPSGNCADDLHALNPATGQWTPLADAGTPPQAESGFTGAHDPVGERLIVFGGTSPGPRTFTTWYDRVWSLSLSGTPTWTLLEPTGTRPSARRDAFMLHDAAHRRMLLFGGADSLAIRKDLWALSLDGAPSWSAIPTVNAPAAPVTGVELDTLRRRLVAFVRWPGGESDDSLSVWTLPLEAPAIWTEMRNALSPPRPRWGHSTMYDPRRDRIVISGGSAPYTFNHGENDVWAISFDRTTPAALHFTGWRLVGSALSITWHSSEPGLVATVHRQAPGEPWKAVATIRAGGDGRLEWRDDAPVIGMPVRYRLVIEGGETRGESEIVVPRGSAMSLRIVGANPVAGALRFEFVLPSEAPARLQIVDVAGRRVLERPLAATRAGQLVVDAASPPPGVYFVRLEQGGAVLVRRAVILD